MPIKVRNTRQKIFKTFLSNYNLTSLKNSKINLSFLNLNENEKKLFKLFAFLVDDYEVNFELKTLLDFYNLLQSGINNIESFYRYVFNQALNINFKVDYYTNNFEDQFYIRKSNSDITHYNAYIETSENFSEEIIKQIETESIYKIISEISKEISNTFDNLDHQENSLIKFLIKEFYISLENIKQNLQKISNFDNYKGFENNIIELVRDIFYDLFKSSKYLIALKYMNKNNFDFNLETLNYINLTDTKKETFSNLIETLIVFYKKIFIALIENIENSSYGNIFNIDDFEKLYRTTDSLIKQYHLFFIVNIENLLENLLNLFNNFQVLRKIIKAFKIDQNKSNSINDIFDKNKNVNLSVLNLYKLIKIEINEIENQFKENFKDNMNVNKFSVFINYNLLNEKIEILNELITSLNNYLPNIDYNNRNNIITESNILFYYNNLKNVQYYYPKHLESTEDNLDNYIELQNLNYYFKEININPNLLTYENFYLSLDNLFSYELKDLENYQNLSKFFSQYLLKNKIYEIRENILLAADRKIMLSSYDFARLYNSFSTEKNKDILRWIENNYPFLKIKIKNVISKKENENLNQSIKLQKINQIDSENIELIFNYKKQFIIQNLFKNYFKFGAFFEKENYLFFFQAPEILTLLKTLDLLNFDINLKIKINKNDSKFEINNIEWEYDLESIKENILNNLNDFKKKSRFNISLSKYKNEIINFYLNLYQELLNELKNNITENKNEFEEILNISEKDFRSIILTFQNKILEISENHILNFIKKKRNEFQFRLMRQIILYKNEFLKKEFSGLNEIDNPDVYDFYEKLNHSKKIIVVSFSHMDSNLYTFNPFYNNTYNVLKRLFSDNHPSTSQILNIYNKINNSNNSKSSIENILNESLNNKFKLTFSQFYYMTDDFEIIKSHFQDYIKVAEDLSESRNKIDIKKKKLLTYLFYQNFKWLDNHFSKYENLNVDLGTYILPLKAYYPNIIVYFDDKLNQVEYIKAFQNILDSNLFYFILKPYITNEFLNSDFNEVNIFYGYINNYELRELYSFSNDEYLYLDIDIKSNFYKFRMLLEDLKNLFYMKELKNIKYTNIYLENLTLNFWKNYLLNRENLLNFLEASKKLYFIQIAFNLNKFKTFKDIQKFKNNVILTNYKLFKEFFKSNKININFSVI